MDPFENLLASIEAYSVANAEYNKAKEGCRDSYFLSRESSNRDRTKKQLKEALDEYVRQVIAMKEVG